MTYLELLQALEHRLGNQHLPLNPRASSLKNLFEGSPVHHDLMHRVVQALYRANNCRALTDAVATGPCFDAVGPIRRDALKTADVDVCHLLDDLCHALDAIFGTEHPTPTGADKGPADVIPLDAARRRRNGR